MNVMGFPNIPGTLNLSAWDCDNACAIASHRCRTGNASRLDQEGRQVKGREGGGQQWYAIVTAAGKPLCYAGKVVLFPTEQAAENWTIAGDQVREWNDDGWAAG